MHNFSYLALLLIVIATLPAAFADATDPQLNGQVQENAPRVSRPKKPITSQKVTTPTLHRFVNMDDSSFKLGVKKAAGSLDAQIELNAPSLFKEPLFPSVLQTGVATSITAVTPDLPSKQPGNQSPTKAAPFSDDINQPSANNRRKIVIRMKQFRSGSHAEFAWEGARMANIMLGKGADVTVFLDMDAIHAADKNDTTSTEFEPMRGHGNSSAPRYTTPQDLLTEFARKGGKLVISDRWAKLGFLGGGYSHPFIEGTQLLSDDSMADLLLEPDITVLDY